MSEALIWIAVIIGVPSLLAGFGMAAAFIVGARAESREDFRGDQWP